MTLGWSPAYMQRARLRTETGDLDGALFDLGKVMEIHPTDPELYLNRGICFYKMGQPAEAAADLHRVLKLTNHTDFAEPAKGPPPARIGSPGLPAPPRPPAPAGGQGTPESSALPERKTQDYIL